MITKFRDIPLRIDWLDTEKLSVYYVAVRTIVLSRHGSNLEEEEEEKCLFDKWHWKNTN